MVSVYVTGRDLDRLAVRSGQYFVVRFLTRDAWWRAHPYSLSSAPNGAWLRFTVKALGDDSARVRDVAGRAPASSSRVRTGSSPGASRTRPKVTLIAGGIGISPLRALLESLAAKPGELTLLYRASAAERPRLPRRARRPGRPPGRTGPLPRRPARHRRPGRPVRRRHDRPTRSRHRRPGRVPVRARRPHAPLGGGPAGARRAARPGPRRTLRVLSRKETTDAEAWRLRPRHDRPRGGPAARLPDAGGHRRDHRRRPAAGVTGAAGTTGVTADGPPAEPATARPAEPATGRPATTPRAEPAAHGAGAGSDGHRARGLAPAGAPSRWRSPSRAASSRT